MENQKSSFLRIYDAGPFAWVGQNIEYVFTMIESRSKEIIPNMSWMCGSGMTRTNVPQTSLVIDSGATIPFFSNKDLLQLVQATKSVKIHCSGSTFDQAMVGQICNELKNLPFPRGGICIAKDGIANLLSMSKLVKERYLVRMDSDVENVINVYNEDGSYIKFVCVQDRLYCINLDSGDGYTNFLTTVTEHKDHFSDIDNKRADLAQYIQKCLCLQFNVDLTDAIDRGGIKECWIDRRHIKIANVIFGPAQVAVEGKTVQSKNKMPCDSSLITNISSSIIERYGNVTLGIDVLHINKCPYINAISKYIKPIQCMGTLNKNTNTFIATIKKFKSNYMI